MTGFDLPQNFHSNLELLLIRVRPRIVPPQISLSAAELVIASSSALRAMAQKTLHDYSAPSTNQVPTGPEFNTGGEKFTDQDWSHYDGAGQHFLWQGQ